MDSLVELLRDEVEKDLEKNRSLKGNDKDYNVATKRVISFLQQRIEFLDWYFTTEPEDRVCVVYEDTWFGWWQRTVQVWFPVNCTITLPKLIYDTPFNNAPIPDALYYTGTDSLVIVPTVVSKGRAIELRWRSPNWWEFQSRRVKKKVKQVFS